jgi:hypothetical protein
MRLRITSFVLLYCTVGRTVLVQDLGARPSAGGLDPSYVFVGRSRSSFDESWRHKVYVSMGTSS